MSVGVVSLSWEKPFAVKVFLGHIPKLLDKLAPSSMLLLLGFQSDEVKLQFKIFPFDCFGLVGLFGLVRRARLVCHPSHSAARLSPVETLDTFQKSGEKLPMKFE